MVIVPVFYAGGQGSIPNEGIDIGQCLSKLQPPQTKVQKWYQQILGGT